MKFKLSYFYKIFLSQSVVIKILADLQTFVSKDKSSLASWHPIFGWYKENCDLHLKASISYVTKQLQVLWKRSTIEILFHSLPPLQTDTERTATKTKGNFKIFKLLLFYFLDQKTEELKMTFLLLSIRWSQETSCSFINWKIYIKTRIKPLFTSSCSN